jgi:excisionase family DNA binding protein
MVDKMKNDDEKLPELLTLKEASEILKVHPNTLRAWDKKGILVAVRLGERKIRKYRKEDIENLINSKSN